MYNSNFRKGFQLVQRKANTDSVSRECKPKVYYPNDQFVFGIQSKRLSEVSCTQSWCHNCQNRIAIVKRLI